MEIIYPFSTSVNPLSEEIDKKVIDWAEDIGLLHTREMTNIVIQMKINWFASCLYPKADSIRLLPISKLFLILFLLDDFIDNRADPPNRGFVFQLFKDFVDILYGREVKLKNPYTTAFSSFCTEWKAIVEAKGFKVFSHYFIEYISFQTWEIDLNRKNEIPSTNQYSCNRPIASGAYLAVYFLRDMHNLISVDDLSIAIQLKDLEAKATLLICLANDLTSFYKELKEGSFYNYVIILIKKYGVLTSTAISMAEKKHHSILFQFNQHCSYIVKSPETRLPYYLDSLKSMIAGSNYWSYMETNRYYHMANGKII
ncbi:hypothetical protein ACFSKL_10180 [Belliella marina]|uniref:Terpene synthase n=1 Tax=Belliella marina TaxID=1644146 RepID=A0ABW4VQX1_9BACT